MDELNEIKAIFFQECEEQLSALEGGLLALDEGRSDADTVNAIFRAAHSIKGGAGAFGFDELVRFAHVFETTLDAVRSGRLEPDSAVMPVLMRGADMLADLVRASQAGSAASIDCDPVAAAFSQLLDGTAQPSAAAPDEDFTFVPLRAELDTGNAEAPTAVPVNEWHIRFAPLPALYGNGNEAGLLIGELGRLGELSTTVDSSRLPGFATLDPEGAFLAWDLVLRSTCARAEILDVFDFVEGECELSVETRSPDAKAAATQPPGLSDADLLAMIRQVGADVPPPAPASPAPPLAASKPAPAPLAVAAPGNAEPVAAAVPAPAAAAAEHAPTIRVDLDRVDRLIDLVGELVINEAMLSQGITEAGAARNTTTSVALDALRQLTREIQDSVMAIRAQPVRSVFQRMPRLVREVSAMTGKPVRLVMEGETTEVDKTVIERLADPLTHMIRNAVDHGLESSADRRARGKPEEGLVRLGALHRSGRIVIEVSDDGGGIDRARVKAKAVEKGLVPDGPMSDEEVDNLIFLPGFSTAPKITDLSGRGVGMDVVKRSVQALGGRISVASRPGEGSTFTLSLPLTLAVLDGMVVTVAGHTVVIPLSAIVETLQPRSSGIHQLGEDVQVVEIRGGYVPLTDVGVALGYRSQSLPPGQGVAILVESESGFRTVLLADAIDGQRQVVIKSLETNYGPVPGIAAATVMGDGRVALILDVEVIASTGRRPEAAPEYLQINHPSMEAA